VNGMTHGEAKRLAKMIHSPHTRQEITDREWYAIADILKQHKRRAQPPLLEDRDYEANRVIRAQHTVAANVLLEQKIYRKQHNCKRVPGTATSAMLEDFIKAVAKRSGIDPQRLRREAILTIMKNRRIALSTPRMVLLP
jgi:hypothetical protein